MEKKIKLSRSWDQQKEKWQYLVLEETNPSLAGAVCSLVKYVCLRCKHGKGLAWKALSTQQSVVGTGIQVNKELVPERKE